MGNGVMVSACIANPMALKEPEDRISHGASRIAVGRDIGCVCVCVCVRRMLP